MGPGQAFRRVARWFEIVTPVLLVAQGVALAQDARMAPAAGSERWGLSWEGLLRAEAALRLDGTRTLSKERNLLRLRCGVRSPGSLSAAVGVRAFYDAAYDVSERYPQEVEQELESEATLREAYLDWSGERFSLRVGKQQVVWGEAFGRFLTDIVVPKDLREFLLPDFEYVRIPLWLASLSWTRDDVSLQAVLAPELEYSVLPPPGADFTPRSAGVGAVARVERTRQPAQTLRNSERGLRLSWLKGGWDASFLLWRGFDDLPAPFRRTEVDPISGTGVVVLSPGPHRFTTLGGTVSKGRGRAVYRGEVAYDRGRLFGALSATDPDGVVEADSVGVIGGMDLSLPRRTLLGVQVLHQEVIGSSRALQGPPGPSALMLRCSTSEIGGRWSGRLEIHYGREGDSMIRPRIGYRFRSAVELAGGFDLFAGPADSFYGQFASRDRVFVEVSYPLFAPSSGVPPAGNRPASPRPTESREGDGRHP